MTSSREIVLGKIRAALVNDGAPTRSRGNTSEQPVSREASR